MLPVSSQRTPSSASPVDARLSACQYIKFHAKPLAGLCLAVGFLVLLAMPNREPLPMAAMRIATAGALVLSGARVARYPLSKLQQSFNDCSVAVVNELLTRMSVDVPAHVVAQAIPLNATGVSLDQLAQSLTSLALPADVFRGLSYEDLQSGDIALLNSHHFVLITTTLQDIVKYFDPVVGLVQQSSFKFDKAWTGKVVRLRDKSELKSVAIPDKQQQVHTYTLE